MCKKEYASYQWATGTFNNSKDLYNNTLSASKFQQKIKFEQGNTSATPNKNRKKEHDIVQPSL